MKASIAVATGLAALITGAGAVWGPWSPGEPPLEIPGRAAADEEVMAAVQARLETAPDDSALVAYYTGEGARIIWLAGKDPSERGEAFLEALREVDVQGVDPAMLELSALVDHREAARTGRPDPQELAAFELAFSRGFLELSRTLLQGSDPEGEQEVRWELDRDQDPGAWILRQVASGEVDEVLASLRPTLEVYDETVAALDDYRARAEERGGWPRVGEVEEVAGPGDTLLVVAEVRRRLQDGMDPVERRLAGEGRGNPQVLDPHLAAALAHFQGRHGIAVDSVIGPETVRAMNVPLEQRIDELRLNLDRIRRLPRDFGERAVLVNIAGFELRVLENNQPTMSMAVVVGQPSWRTTVFQDEIDHLVVNPYWHVPESIEGEELLPRVQEDPDHLVRQDISLVPAGDNFGTPVATDTIDWARVDPDDFPYDFRQEPGPRNALGRVKFMFPNPHNIYLHDTPADQLFQRDFRAFSHGCVRVERPMELARYLLETSSGMDAADFDRILASGERTRLDLQQPVPVYLAYLTTWVEDGTVSFHQDIYNFDDASME